jgi:hypothetical protein
MDLDEIKQRSKQFIEKLEDQANKLEKILILADKFKQPTVSELYNGIEDYFSVRTINGNYEHILGGDGRSLPWSETRTGKITIVKINEDIYLSSDQINTVREYVKNKHNPDHVQIDFDGKKLLQV